MIVRRKGTGKKVAIVAVGAMLGMFSISPSTSLVFPLPFELSALLRGK